MPNMQNTMSALGRLLSSTCCAWRQPPRHHTIKRGIHTASMKLSRRHDCVSHSCIIRVYGSNTYRKHTHCHAKPAIKSVRQAGAMMVIVYVSCTCLLPTTHVLLLCGVFSSLVFGTACLEMTNMCHAKRLDDVMERKDGMVHRPKAVCGSPVCLHASRLDSCPRCGTCLLYPPWHIPPSGSLYVSWIRIWVVPRRPRLRCAMDCLCLARVSNYDLFQWLCGLLGCLGQITGCLK